MMSRAGSGETGAGVLFLCKPSQRSSRTLALATSFTNVVVDFDFELLLSVMMQRQLVGQPAKGWSQPVLETNSLSP
jgi:hypothetical protein